MGKLELIWPARADRWRKPAIVAASLLLHAGLLAWIGLRTMGLGSYAVPAPEPTIYLQIEPRPLLADETPRQPVAARQVEAPPLARSMTTPNVRDEDDETPSPPSPRLAAPAPDAPPAPADGWRVRPRTLGDRIGQGLRTSPVGCASPALLSAAERAICDDRFGRRAAAASPIDGTGNPERDARFAREGARRLAQWEAQRRPLSGGPGVVGPADCVGSNFGTGCAGAHLDPSMRQDAPSVIQQDSNRLDPPRRFRGLTPPPSN